MSTPWAAPHTKKINKVEDKIIRINIFILFLGSQLQRPWNLKPFRKKKKHFSSKWRNFFKNNITDVCNLSVYVLMDGFLVTTCVTWLFIKRCLAQGHTYRAPTIFCETSEVTLTTRLGTRFMVQCQTYGSPNEDQGHY